ncbi:Non-specific lipid-transfer protein 2 [Cardamine amara subsp. amara]|uniref:Non-specific lipid-transfer protein 2 n=1 Tax=Cardamine amara subsp. amara TaxID=228776 RepID=A0ABD0ZTW2_CARAN
MDGLMKLSYLIFACMIVAGPITSNAALACTTVKVILKPCFPYLTQRAPLTSRCCNGVRNLNGRALTTLDRAKFADALNLLLKTQALVSTLPVLLEFLGHVESIFLGVTKSAPAPTATP